MQTHVGRYGRRMFAGGIGPLASFPVLILLPIAGAFLLPTREFAVWAILNSVATVALATDFGGTAYVAANANKVRRPWPLVFKGILISSGGSALVCAVCMVVWIPYSTTDAAGNWSVLEGESALLVILFASILRSVSSVLAASALARLDYASRNILLLGQAVLVVIFTVCLILLTSSAWALPLGWLLATGLSLVVVWPKVADDLRRDLVGSGRAVTPRIVGSAREFTIKRTVASLIGNVLLQGDRWVIGVAAGPEFLAAYELVWRFASAPRLVALSLTAALVPEAGVAARDSNLRRLVDESSRIVWGVSALAAGVACAAIFSLGFIGKVDIAAVSLGLVLVVSLSINGRTAVTSAIGIGIGWIGVDISYLFATLVLTILVWGVAVSLGSGVFLVIGESVMLAVMSFVFMFRSERAIVDTETNS